MDENDILVMSNDWIRVRWMRKAYLCEWIFLKWGREVGKEWLKKIKL